MIQSSPSSVESGETGGVTGTKNGMPRITMVRTLKPKQHSFDLYSIRAEQYDLKY